MCVSVGINFLNLSIFLGRNLSIELKKRLSCFLPTNANLIRIPRHTAYQVLIIRQWFYKGNNITLYTRKICEKKCTYSSKNKPTCPCVYHMGNSNLMRNRSPMYCSISVWDTKSRSSISLNMNTTQLKSCQYKLPVNMWDRLSFH